MPTGCNWTPLSSRDIPGAPTWPTAAAGVSERAIMAQPATASLTTLQKYICSGSLFLENAAAKVGL